MAAASWLQNVWKHVRAPRVSEERLNQCLEKIHRDLPAPVFWLLGKAQSGKTSIIRAMTGNSRAEIGGGFRPCTRTAQIYPFPAEENCLVRFLDTRGLGEVAYDPAEDIGVLEQQAHCLVVVIKAMDHAQQSVLEPMGTILKAHPDWPLLVVQTTLHEGYPAPDTRHIDPYPYADDPLPTSVPADLARSLAAQRQWFAGYRARFVPVDFTMPEDGYQPEHYGLEAIWEAIEEAVPLGLRAMLGEAQAARRSLRDVYFRTAHPHIISYAVAAGVIASVPVPMIDIPVFVGIQAKMFHALASIYGQEMSAQRMAEISGTLGVGFLVRLGGRELLKFIPGFGSAVSALFAAASTYALGCTLCAYFSFVRDGDVPDPALLRQLYREQYAEGRRRLREYLDHAAGRKGVQP
jgi:uncharacterized protein (DUF697 family)